MMVVMGLMKVDLKQKMLTLSVGCDRKRNTADYNSVC